MTVILIAQTLGFGVGAMMCVLFLRLLSRRPPALTHAYAKYLQAIIALSWCLGSLCVRLLVIAGFAAQSVWLVAADCLTFAGGVFFPVSFLVLWQRPRTEDSWSAQASRWLYGLALLSASALTLYYGFSRAAGADSHCRSAILGLVLHVATVTLGALLLLRRSWSRDFAARFYAVMMVCGVMTPAVIALLSRAYGWQSEWLAFAEQQAPLLMMFGMTFYFRDFRLSNVFIKASVRLLTALLLALGSGVWLLWELPRVVRQIAVFPTAGSVIAATACLTLLLCGFVWLLPKLDYLVDGWLFREPDYAAVTRQCWENLAHEEEAETMFASVAQFARTTLLLEDTRIIPLVAPLVAFDTAQHAATLNSGELCELKPGDPLRARMGEEVEFLAPIRVGGQVTHVLAIAPGAQRRNLLDSELSWLRGLAGQVSSRLESLALERARQAQQNKEERLRRQITEAELRALRTQINPHFLFNSLNTIADLIVANPQQAERVTVQLAKIFRHVLRGSECPMISVREELDFLKTWLDIEALRFGDRLRVQFTMDESLAAASVPSLILQPLVENALKHGLAPKIGGGTLQVSVRRIGKQLSLMVEDDGLGFARDPATLMAANETARNGHSIGLRNVAERLATSYGGRAQMNCETVATGGSRVTLLLPCET
ncbi:MAG: histidine kinase [Acidobacteria bacterium]|nr:histidine kinase [Acidobacteriota bacterium]MBI3426679.1 histidine kinase [Acidobacteriota bacterium]